MDHSLFRPAASFLALSGVLHLIVPIFAGLGPFALGMVAIGVIYIGASFLLRQGARWFGYVIFIVMLVGAVAAYGLTGQGIGDQAPPMPNWLCFAIIAADIGCALSLFTALWHSPAHRT